MAQPGRPFTAIPTPDDFVPLRRNAALARTLLDELDRTLPISSTIQRSPLPVAVRDQLAEELGRMGCRLLECAAALTEDLLRGPPAGRA